MQKIEQGRERLIFILSLEDQMVDRMLFQTWVEEKPDEVTSKVGWSPLPAGYRAIERDFPGGGLATDCSAFDWTLPGWLAREIVALKISQTCAASDEWRRAVWRRAAEVIGPKCVVRLPNGERFRQTNWGLMKSGWFLTIAVNGACQALLVSAAEVYLGLPERKAWAMGDDLLIGAPPDCEAFVGLMDFMGVVVKQFSVCSEFAGFDFSKPGAPTPLYATKHLERLRWVPEDMLETYAMAYGLYYALANETASPKIRLIKQFVDRHSPWPPWLYHQWALGLDTSGGPAARLPDTLKEAVRWL